MKRIIFIFGIICFLLFDSMHVFSQNNGVIRKIVIDAGHGGKDPGAVGKNSREKDITLSIALKTGSYIERNFPDVEVIYTRKTDRFIKLRDRARIANEAGAHLFISIHCNANTSSKIYGAETYVMGLHKSEDNLEVAKLENASILKEEDYSEHYEGFNPNSPEAYIIFSLYQNAHLEQSLNIASKVQNQFRERVGIRDRGVLQAGFWVLYKTTMPGILVETGYLSNSKDEQFLLTRNGQNYIASTIYRAFKEYKQEYEQGNNEVAESVSFEKKDAQVIYRVQILSSDKKLKSKDKRLKGLKNIYNYKHQGMYKYCTGEEILFSTANDLKIEMRAKGFKDAFIVAFKDNQRISLSEAKELSEN